MDTSTKVTQRRRKRLPDLGKIDYEKVKASGLCMSCRVPGKPRVYGLLCVGCGLTEKHRALRIKKEVMDLYGGKCECCGETHIAFLTIDHINHDGQELRNTGKQTGGGSFYKRLRRQPRDPSLQVMCFNCNLARRVTGVCPHKEDSYFREALQRGRFDRLDVQTHPLPRPRERHT